MRASLRSANIPMAPLSFIRFEDPNGIIRYGEPTQKDLTSGLLNTTIKVLEGDPFGELIPSGEEATVVRVRTDSGCQSITFGLLIAQYVLPGALSTRIDPNHSMYWAELQKARPRGQPRHRAVPGCFYQACGRASRFVTPNKFMTLLLIRVGPYDDVHVHPDATSKLDYEGELCVVIGKDCKNITEDHALDHVLGYTIGNDISARNFQLPNVSGGQFCYAKSFDGFAPIGPAIATTHAVPNPQVLSYVTRVDGETRQETSTDDMIWTVRQIIAHLSRGTTLRKGTVIMTGTPAGEISILSGIFLCSRC